VAVTGRIVQFNKTRGYGFIAPDGGGDDVFLHMEELKAHAQTARAGMRVQFEVMEGQRGLKAYDVKVLDAPSSSAIPREDWDDDDGLDDDLSDVIPAAEYTQEITDVLIAVSPAVTAAQIVEIRQRLVASARRRGWLQD